MTRKIRKVAVLGSGIMGSRIACHFANIGLEVLLLDIITPNLAEGSSKDDRNTFVNKAFSSALRSNPSPIYSKQFARNIKTGNFEDDLHRIGDSDWIIEVVIERLDIKKILFEEVEKYRRKGSLITSNTSGIPIELMLEGRSEDFQANFCGTHFFNPPRYLKLLEIIPSSKTSSEVVDFFLEYGNLYLGKTTVKAKDTPAFIANRIGVFSIMAIFKYMQKHELSIEEVDLATGPVSGRPKSATFRTSDLVGLDTLVKVAGGVHKHCIEDEMNKWFEIPDFLTTMLERNWLGDKTSQGFYKKSKDSSGNRVIEQLNLTSFDYEPLIRPRYDSIGKAKKTENTASSIRSLFDGDDKIANFFKEVIAAVSAYSTNRIPEIADEIYQIDEAMKAGFGWEAGPFETWDILGFNNVLKAIKASDFEVPEWINDFESNGYNQFYIVENNQRKCYSLASGHYEIIPGTESLVVLENYRSQSPVYGNKEASLHDIGDGVLCLEFHSKMNAIGSGTLAAINRSIEIAEMEGWNGLVIGNDAPNFSAGANLAMMLMLAIEQEFDELNVAIKYFQNTVMRLRYSSIPVVIAPHGLTLGGGCEMTLHADSAVASTETYIGLVEAGAGLIPGGGGTKEFVLRTSDGFTTIDPQLPALQDRFTTIATAKVATSAHEAFEIGVMHKDKDEVVVNGHRLIAEAKRKVIELANDGYVQKPQREDILVLGRTALGALYSGIESFGISNYASEHDQLISRKLAFVMAGGDFTQPTQVTEQYLLNLEREAFLSLLGERKTLQRIQHILKTGKPLRN
ncbi:MAG: 3-hydroxyacyl-CoA dehydrogenase/enoyl-CoA hydratase family protein [Bacteroidia bacterium]|nr:3-hydroxyacyl-CoA dehydrogenase/enoyl-CoA hydratase family protein [Bacteroidia bacterium]